MSRRFHSPSSHFRSVPPTSDHSASAFGRDFPTLTSRVVAGGTRVGFRHGFSHLFGFLSLVHSLGSTYIYPACTSYQEIEKRYPLPPSLSRALPPGRSSLGSLSPSSLGRSFPVDCRCRLSRPPFLPPSSPSCHWGTPALRSANPSSHSPGFIEYSSGTHAGTPVLLSRGPALVSL